MSTIRITGGRLRGMSINVVANEVARYTASKVRQAIFNITGDMEGRSVLELFAGSGSFSIEALSRGAAHATLVEADRGMARLIGKNLEKTALNKYCQVMHMDVRYAVPLLFGRKCIYDIIFMDPPYEMGYVMEIMTLLQAHPLFNPDTIVIAEYSRREKDTLSYCESFNDQKTRKYGDTVVSILRDIHIPA